MPALGPERTSEELTFAAGSMHLPALPQKLYRRLGKLVVFDDGHHELALLVDEPWHDIVYQDASFDGDIAIGQRQHNLFFGDFHGV
jgi:hypothetical protein